MYAVWAFDDTAYASPQGQNTPTLDLVFEDEGNTATGGNMNGAPVDDSGQLPGVTTRCDSLGAAVTVDRIQNVVESFDTDTYKRRT